MKLHYYILLLISLSSVLFNSCETERHPVPNYRFSVTIDLNLPDYNSEFFTLNRDRYGRKAGISGVLIIRKGFDEYYAFERYCPYDNSENCKVSFDDEEFDTVITNYSDDSNVKQEAEPKRKTEYQRLESTFTSKYHFENKSSKSSKKAAMEEASNENDIEYKEVEEYEWFKNPNDLQRAFVYSEILKRPDI